MFPVQRAGTYEKKLPTERYTETCRALLQVQSDGSSNERLSNNSADKAPNDHKNTITATVHVCTTRLQEAINNRW